MPILGALLSSLFTGLAAALVQWWTKKATTAIFGAAALFACAVVLMAAFNTLIAPMVQSMFQTQYGQFIGLAFPPIAGTCMAAISATWAGCALYKLKVASIKLTASA